MEQAEGVKRWASSSIPGKIYWAWRVKIKDFQEVFWFIEPVEDWEVGRMDGDTKARRMEKENVRPYCYIHDRHTSIYSTTFTQNRHNRSTHFLFPTRIHI